MKLSTDTNKYTTTITKAADFGIEEEDLSHIMGILRSQIYSDKLLAVIREYSTNARDANIEAGVKSAIDVILPTFASPELSFRDYGYGLTDEEVCNLYVKYGASTKRNSNDYTGCLGIGCKAAFAYGDQFTIESYTENRITTWLAAIDESKKGTISLISEKPNEYRGTDTGVKVTVHIRKQDIDDCVKKAKKFFKYWKQNEVRCNEELKYIDAHTETDNWAIQHASSDEIAYYRHRRGKAVILMGGIAYPLDKDQCLGLEEASYLLNNDDVILKAPLGSLEIAANREALEYTDKTKITLNVMANKMRADLIQIVNQHIASQPTRLAASIASNMFERVLGDTISKQLSKDATWKGKVLLTDIDFGTKTTCYYRKKSWRSGEYKNKKEDDTQKITLSESNHLVVWDSDNIAQSNAARRVRTLQKENGWDPMARYYVIRKSNLHLVDPMLEPTDYTDLTHITPLKAERTIITKTDGTKTKSVKISVCHLKQAKLKSERLSEEAEPIANKNGQFIYVPLDRFDWVGRLHALDNLDSFHTALTFLGEENRVIHGVKKHYLKKLNSDWIPLDTHLETLWNAWLKTHAFEHQALKDCIAKVDHDDYWLAPDILINVQHPDIHYIARILQMREDPHLGPDGTQQPDMRRTANLMRQLGLFNKSTDLNDKITRLNLKYPLLRIIQEHWRLKKDYVTIGQELTKYINS